MLAITWRNITASLRRQFRLLCVCGGALLFSVVPPFPLQRVEARVLTGDELQRIATIRTSFTRLLMEIAQVAKRPDLSDAESECVNSVFRELMQTSQELGSYEYLITIEAELTEVDDDASMKGILRFAVDKALDVLETEHKRLGEVSEQCPRNSAPAGKAQQAIAFIVGTAGILKSIQPRL